MKKHFLFATTAATILCLQHATAQNSSPYWSLAGNSNATSTSKLGTTNGINLRLYTNNSERMRITTSGLVGIGTTAPTERLHVNSASGANAFRAQVNGNTKLLVASNGGVAVGANTTPPTNGLYVKGFVGIGTSSASYPLHVEAGSAGTAVYANTTGNYGVFANSGYIGVYGQGGSYGVYGYSTNGNGIGASSGNGWGVYAYGASGVYGNSQNAAYGVMGVSSSTYSSNGSTGVYGSAYYGVHGVGSYGLWAEGIYDGVYAVASGSSGIGTYAYGPGYGLYGSTSSGVGVYGYTGGGSNSFGVYGYNASTGYGVKAYCEYGSGIYASSGSNWAGYFAGKVFATTYTSSDRKLKKDISDLSSAMDIINKLQPKQYEFRQDGNYKYMHLEEGKHYGLIAQDLEQVLPNLVKQTSFDPNVEMQGPAKVDAKGLPIKQESAQQKAEVIDFKAVNYTELIPIIIKGMQEQAETIKEQQQQINDLKDQISRITGNGNILTSAGSLSQNTPNPVRGSTRISYSLPTNSKGQLVLTDALGRTIKVVSLNNSGNVNLNTAGLSSGMYNYSLMVNGKIVESKKMEIVH